MSYTERLPQFVHICIPPILGHNSPLTSQDWESSPSNESGYLKERGSSSFSLIGKTRDGGPHLSQLPSKGSIPQIVQSNHAKVVFDFVDVHEPSGKTTSATQSHIRSILMRKTHERRRKLQKSVKDQYRTFSTSYNNLEYHTDVVDKPDIHPMNQPVQSNSLPKLKNSFPIPSQKPTHATLGRISDARKNSTDILSDSFWCTSCGRLIIRGGEFNFVKYTSGPQTLLDTSIGDPFNSSPIRVTHRMHEFIHDYIFNQQIKTNPHIYSGDKESFLRLLQVSSVLSDPACIHAIVAASSDYQIAARQKKPLLIDEREARSETNHHIFEAVRLLNEKLGDPKEALTNSSLVAATILKVVSAFTGDDQQRAAHNMGVIQMINLRGGIDTLPRTLAHQMSRTDSMTAWREQSKVQLPMYRSRFRDNRPLISAVDVCNKSVSELFPDNQYFVSKHPRHSPFQNTKLESFLWGELFSLACELHGLTYMLELHLREPKKIGLVQREFFEDTYAAIQRAFVSFPLPTDKGIILSTAYYRQNCWRLTALLYINTAVRIFPLGSTWMQSVLSALLSSLHLSDLVSTWHTNSDILLWILFIGSFSAVKEDDSSWFLVKIRHLVNLLDLKSIGQLEDLLQSFLYRKFTYGIHLRKVWEGCQNVL